VPERRRGGTRRSRRSRRRCWTTPRIVRPADREAAECHARAQGFRAPCGWFFPTRWRRRTCSWAPVP